MNDGRGNDAAGKLYIYEDIYIAAAAVRRFSDYAAFTPPYAPPLRSCLILYASRR